MRTIPLATCLALVVGLGTASPTAGQSGPTGPSGATGPTGLPPIPITVLHGSSGQALALVKVTIGSATGLFIIDTGATKTLIDRRVAMRLGLTPAGRSRRISGIGCTQTAQPVHLTNWKVGAIDLPPEVAASSRFPLAHGTSILGLLGSDVLSHFGAVNIDYAHSQMVLGS
jgi:predicted aspartyl protease